MPRPASKASDRVSDLIASVRALPRKRGGPLPYWISGWRLAGL